MIAAFKLFSVHQAVADIDVEHIAGTDVIVRPIHFVRTQRNPAHWMTADIHREIDARRTQPGDHCRCIYGYCGTRAGYPAPAIAQPCPATIVKGCKSPGRIVYPGPAPWGNPGPVSVLIRCPASDNAGGLPYITVFLIPVPAAVIIKVFVTNHTTGYIARRIHPVSALIALACPAIEFIHAWQIIISGGQSPGALQTQLFIIINSEALLLPSHFRPSTTYLNDSVVIAIGNFHPISTGFQHGNGGIGCIQLDRILFAKAANSGTDQPLRDFNLQDIITQFQQT